MKLKSVSIVLIIVISLSAYLFFINKELYRIIIAEDSVVENITSLTMFTISILLIIRMLRCRKKTKWYIYNITLALACFFFAGEEISWGQRIFSIETSEFMNTYNLQHETNIHNLKFGDFKLNRWIFSSGLYAIVFLYFSLSLFLYKRVFWFKTLCDKFGVQIPKRKDTLVIFISILLIYFIPDEKKWEFWEAVFSLIFLSIFLDPYNEEEKLLPTKSSGIKTPVNSNQP